MQNNYKPLSIIYKDKEKKLYLLFQDGLNISISTELLRVESPSAEVQGHNKSQKIVPTNKKNISIINIERVGNYAIRIHFNDGHNTGIYSWELLRSMSINSEKLLKEYKKKIQSTNKISKAP